MATVDWNRIIEAFFVALATATAGVFIGGVVALMRFIRRMDAQRIDQLKGTQHRQWHVVRWARVVGRHVGIPFPLEDDIDDNDEWDEGLR